MKTQSLTEKVRLFLCPYVNKKIWENREKLFFRVSKAMAQKSGLVINFDSLEMKELELSIIVIEKTPKSIDYYYQDITPKNIQLSFFKTILFDQKRLEALNPSKLQDQFYQKYSNLVSSNPQNSNDEKEQEDYFLYCQNEFLLFKPWFEKFSWYGVVKTGPHNVSVSPIKLHSEKPGLIFEALKKGSRFELKTFVLLNQKKINLDEFSLRGFMLKRDNDCYVLNPREYKTICWLQSGILEEVSKSQSKFVEEILKKLDGTYKVERGKSFKGEAIQALPEHQIYIREVSNQFLMLSPQWNYEGFTVSGLWKETEEINRDGKIYIIVRNKEEEEQFLKDLKAMHPSFERQKNAYYYVTFEEAKKGKWFYKFFQEVVEKGIELIGMDMLSVFRFSKDPLTSKVEILKEENGVLTLKLQASFGKEKVGLKDLQKTLWSGAHSLVLADNSMGMIDDDWLKQYGLLVKHGIVKDKTTLEVSKLFAILQDQKEGSLVIKQSLNDEWKKKWEMWQNGEPAAVAFPQSVQVTLRPYQQKGFEWMSLLSEIGAGACLADDMGLGKTIQAICFLALQLEKNEKGKHLIVCPASLLYNWTQEWEKFCPSVRTDMYYGPKRDAALFLPEGPQVIITSYSVVRNDIEILKEITFHSVILDESHNVKNPNAQTTQSIYELQSFQKIIMSGTPLTNNTFDLYSQFKFIIPAMFSSKEFFRKEYADPIDIDRNKEKIESLRKLTSPFVLRRTKEQVAKDLPEKTESVIWCTLTPNQRTVYEDVKKQSWKAIRKQVDEEGLEKSKLMILQAMMKLRQVCNSPLLLNMENYTPDTSESVKIETLLYEVENNLSNHKVLIFSGFLGMLDLIGEELESRDLEYYRIDGSVSGQKRQELVNQFQDSENKVQFFLISTKAGNAGLNLTAADYVFLVDPWWNRAIENQAIDRTHRIGQTNAVFAYRMICKDTIEEKILKMQERKKFISDSLITEEDEAFVKNLDMKEIEYLFT